MQRWRMNFKFFFWLNKKLRYDTLRKGMKKRVRQKGKMKYTYFVIWENDTNVLFIA